MFQAAGRLLPDLIDALIVEHHDALLDRLELRINEVAKEIAGSVGSLAGRKLEALEPQET